MTLSGTASQKGDLVKAQLKAEAAGGTADAQGALDLAKMYTDGFTAHVRDMDIAKLLGGGPSSSLAMDLSVRGGGTSLETLQGTMDLTMPPSPISGQTLGPVELHASAAQGRFTLSRLQAQAPGVSLTASGGGTLEDMALKGQLVATNLATFADTVGRLGSGEPMPLSGKGQLHFTAAGAVRRPAITLDGGFDTLAWADTSLKGLWLELRLPDATQPLTSDALLKVKQLTAGGRTYEDLKASLATQGRDITVSVTTLGANDLSLALHGTVDKDNEGLGLEDFSLKYPEAGWTLQEPSHVSWGNGRIEVAPALTLTSGPQLLSLALRMEGEKINANTELRSFDLSRLPKAFLPSSFDMDGLVSGKVKVSGRLPQPDADVELRLEGGRYEQYSDLGLDMKARYLRDRATGTLAASAPAGRISSQFDVPVQGLLRHRREPVSLALTVDQLDLGAAQRMAGQTEAVTGIVSGTMTLKGMANDPRLNLELLGSHIRYWGIPPQQPPPVVLAPGALPEKFKGEEFGFTLTALSNDKDATLSATLDMQGVATKATASLETPFTLGRLIARPPTADQVMNTPMRKLQADIEELPLALLTQMGMVDQAGGSLSLKADLTGPLLSPVGEVKMQAKKASMNGSVPLDGDVVLVTDASSVKLQLAAQRDGAPLAQMDAHVKASLVALQDQDVVGRVPFTIDLKVGPISQQELMGLANAAPSAVSSVCRGIDRQVKSATSAEPQNVLSLDLKARGTLDDPTVDLTAGVQNIGVSQMGLGQANLHYTYANAHSDFTALLNSPKGGTLVAHGKLTQDFSLPTLRKGLHTDRAPLRVDVEAHQFDLGFLSGAQLPMVRSIGGVLAMNEVHVEGTVGAPTLKGTLEWKDGRLALDGMGDYRDIHVALDINDQNFVLSDFSAKSGGGTLKLTAKANRGKSGSFVLSGEGDLNDFPLVLDDQLMALVQLRMNFDGDVSDRLVNVRKLNISEAHVKLPDEKRKDLQPIERPEGIVLTCNGQPLKPTAKPANADAEDTATGGAGPSQGAPQRKYWVNITAPRNLWITGSDVNTELGLSDNFRVEYADTTAIYGEVRVMRGQVDVLGRRFTLQNSSQVRFTGPVLSPYINATAEYDNEKEGVKVFVAVRGQGKDFTIKPTSDPVLSETDIYTLLATGRRTLKAGSGQSSMNQGQVASVLGSVLASQAKKALAAKLPLDVLTIEAGDEGLQGARLEVGKYLTDQLYLGYRGRLGTPTNQSTSRRENANAVRLEYQFGPRWGVEAEYGDAQQGGADIIWSREY